MGHGLLIHEVSRSHITTHHSRYDSSGRVISSSQRPLPDKTQHSQQTNFMTPVGFEPTISAGERPQTYALDRAAPGNGNFYFSNIYIYIYIYIYYSQNEYIIPNYLTIRIKIFFETLGPSVVTKLSLLKLTNIHNLFTNVCHWPVSTLSTIFTRYFVSVTVSTNECIQLYEIKNEPQNTIHDKCQTPTCFMFSFG